jgi:hypothetical protein
MRKTAILLTLLGLGLITAYAASDFWRDKTYTQWTSDEVDKMLADSPWAQGAKASVQQQAGRGGGMGRRGGMGGGMGIPGMGGGGMGRRGGGGYPGGGGGSSIPQVTATIRWQSALPVREALLRQGGEAKPDDSEVAKSLTAPVNGYVIAVLGLPETIPSSRGRSGRGTDTDRDDDARDRSTRDDTTDHSLDQVKSSTYLSRKDKATLFAGKVQRDKDGVTLLFTFPKTTPITLDDKEVEFVTRYGPLEIKKKFKLKDMVYQGKLEL